MSDVEITGNESFEELEAKLALIEGEGDEVVVDDPLVPAPTTAPVTTTTTGDTTQQSTVTVADPVPPAAVPAVAEPTPGVDVKNPVLAKDGVHTIPYEVLEATRERARQAEQRVQELSVSAGKVTELEKQIQTLKQRAVDAGADESLLTEDGLTEDQLSELAEEYPALGRHLRALTQKINAINPAPAVAPTAQPGANPVDVALLHVPDLDAWRAADPDRWDMAVVIDTKLQKDPTFADKTMVQRFQEVERRVKAAFGDTPPAAGDQADLLVQAESKVAAAANKLPGSPSDIGSTVTHTPNKAAQIAAMEGNALLHSMNGMSDADIDNLLSSLDL